MRIIFDFLLKFLTQFVGGFFNIFKGIFLGLIQMLNLPEYFNLFSEYKDDFVFWQWAVAVVFMVLIVAVFVAVIWLIVHYIRVLYRLRSTKVVPQDLVDEIARLNRELAKTTAEKDRILGMRMKQFGVENITTEVSLEGDEDKDKANGVDTSQSRFFKLTEIDEQYANYTGPKYPYDNDISLAELCYMFRNYACSKLHLFYEIRVIRLFFAAFATTRLIILQGISGTGKTSLPYAVGQFLRNPAIIASVQPSWRDRTELFGYFNEFTKRFNETEVLKKMYEATMTEDVYICVLDEMNIARVEYYFAEMLSILEMPTRDSWVVDLVPSGWPSDPRNIVKGRFKLPENMWYVGTANNDDSTFAISDKVYDRAIPININSKGVAFDAPDTDCLSLSYKHLEEMFADAMDKYKVSEENLRKLDTLDDYVIKHFRLAFGNRIVKQLKEFVPAYIACGGSEIDGIDYVLCNKILRKFESLNLGFIKDEIDGLVAYLEKLFGKTNMEECKEYLARLKKSF